jgi:hypothetical protein
MEMSYSADVDSIDEPVQAAAAERTKPEETIRIRIQPSIFRRPLGQHRMWPGVSWTLDCRTVDEAIALREAMRIFFEETARVGPVQMKVDLEALAAEATTTQ